jgi:hypothetical protein
VEHVDLSRNFGFVATAWADIVPYLPESLLYLELNGCGVGLEGLTLVLQALPNTVRRFAARQNRSPIELPNTTEVHKTFAMILEEKTSLQELDLRENGLSFDACPVRNTNLQILY